MLNFHKEPWPHYTGSLPDDFYNYVNENWNTNEEVKKWNKIKNRSNTFITDDKIITTLNEVCLLYTSPSPRDVEEYRMPSSA